MTLRWSLGVDVGGTKIEVALVDGDGRVVERDRRPTGAAPDPAGVIAFIVGAARAVGAGSGAAAPAVGVAVAGQVDRAGVVRGAPNLGWRDVPLRAELERALGRRVLVVNDVRAAGWAEWRHGAGRGSDDLVALFIGTGVGGCIVSGGHMLEGAGNSAGELGHTTLVAGGRPCHCRNRGCLEAYVGGWAIAERAREASRAEPAAAGGLLGAAGALERITAETVAAAHAAGDPLAGRLVCETAEYLGAGLVSVANALNPERIILGGGVIEGLPELVAASAAVARERALPAALDGLAVLRAALVVDAPVIGAAALAREG